jgi:phage-related protein
MAYDEIKPRGSTKASQPDAGGAVLRSVPLFGIVKDNIDPIRSGRLQVYISDLGGSDPNDSNAWVTVSYMSPFYGVTTPSSANTGWGEYIKNPNSYGMWNSQPDLGTTVICIFINGDPNYGFWIGCVPQPEALQMVPAIGGTDNIVANAGEAKGLGGAVRLPVTNLNTNNAGLANSNKFLTDAKPVHSYVASILSQQGLIRDPIRGVIGSSAQRETPSRVGWGVSTPGRPIYEGGFTDETIANAATSEKPTGLKVVARRGGHTLVMDDGDILGKDQLVRLRSSLGHQILMSDDGQTLFIIHANGQSYIELGKEGTIDMYSTNSFNVRTQGDLNLHADNNININAGKQLNISADTIAISSEKETTQKVGTDFSLYASGQYTTKVDGKMSFASAADSSFYSDAITYFNGSKINLNTGASSLIPQEVKPLPITAHTDTLNDATKGWAAAPGKLLSIVSRAPAHAPWASANQGVDVKVNNNASAALPSAPSPAVAAANASAGAPTTPVSVAVASTVPPSSAISAALDKNTTGTMVGQISTLAATGPAAAAVKLGAGVVETAQGAVAAVGAMAQSPAQMEAGGVIKPGSAALVNNLIQGGKTIQQALTPNLFTGKVAENLTSYVNNPVAQVVTQVATFTQAQSALTSTGLITGKESGASIAGLVMSAATAGVQNTVNLVSNAASAVTGAVNGAISNVVGAATGALNSVLGSASSLVSAGNFAGNLASTVTGGLSSIAGALGGMAKGAVAGIAGLLDSAKGVAGSAFAAITGAFPTLTAGVPQNIKEITEKAQAAAQAPSTGGIAGALSAVTGGITGAIGAVTGAVTGAASGLLKTASGITANLSTGLGALPGGASVVASVVNNAVGAINSVPGVSAVTGLIGQASSITNGISNLASVNPLASSGILTAATGAAGALTKGLDDLKSGKLSLASLASAGLPAGAAAQLNSAISSMSSGGAVPIKLPTVAINTNDRSELTAQVTSLLGNSKIPAPNYGGLSSSIKADSDRLNELVKQQQALVVEKDEQQKKVRQARDAFVQARDNLPPGDPAIDIAKQTYIAEVKAFGDITDKISAIANKA